MQFIDFIVIIPYGIIILKYLYANNLRQFMETQTSYSYPLEEFSCLLVKMYTLAVVFECQNPDLCPDFAFILMWKRKLVALLKLSSWCLVTVNVLWLFITVPWVGLQCVIVVFPDHSQLRLNGSAVACSLSVVDSILKPTK